MIKIDEVEVFGWKAAIRGMRNPKNSWDKSDSGMKIANPDDYKHGCNPNYEYIVGNNDKKLMIILSKAGTDHGKFMRMIHVQMDINAPLFWWKQFDTYKIGTVSNSCSTMHRIHSKTFTLDDFSTERLSKFNLAAIQDLIDTLNVARNKFNSFSGEGPDDLGMTKDDWWNQMIELLPSSYNQKRTVDLNYAVLKKMYHSRKNHKLGEWNKFCSWIETLPYSELITEKGD